MLKRTIILVCMVLQSVALFAHEVNHTVQNGKAVIVLLRYGSKEPMSYAAVKIFSPNTTLEYQNGYTDKNGSFAFLPDKPGSWRFVVDDGMGHHVDKMVLVDKGMIAKKDNENAGLRLSQKLIMVLIVIWGTVGTILFFKARGGKK